jgi:hypothetical protein
VRSVADAEFARRQASETSESVVTLYTALEGDQAAVLRSFLKRSQDLHADLREALAGHLQTLTILHEQYGYVAGLLDKFNAEFEAHRVQSADQLKRLERALVPHGTREEHSVALMAQATHLLNEAARHAWSSLKPELERIAGEVKAHVEATAPRVDDYTRKGLPEHLARTLREADLVIMKAEERRTKLTGEIKNRADKLIKTMNGLLKLFWKALIFWGR